MCKKNLRHPVEGAMSGDAFAARLAELSAMPRRLEAAAEAVPTNLWATPGDNGGFSFVEHACHLRDVEAEGFVVRIDRILSETTPALPDIDGARLARERHYLVQDFQAALRGFARARAEVVRRLETLTPAERLRAGVLEGVGEISIDALVSKMLEHDEEHRRDFEALRDRLSGKHL